MNLPVTLNPVGTIRVRKEERRERRYRERYGTSRTEPTRFAPGQLVYARKFDNTPHFTSIWEGPYTVLRPAGQGVYWVDRGHQEPTKLRMDDLRSAERSQPHEVEAQTSQHPPEQRVGQYSEEVHKQKDRDSDLENQEEDVHQKHVNLEGVHQEHESYGDAYQEREKDEKERFQQ